jgi:hypothetical protein
MALRILELHRAGVSNSVIVEELQLTKSIVSKIVCGTTWKELHNV